MIDKQIGAVRIAVAVAGIWAGAALAAGEWSQPTSGYGASTGGLSQPGPVNSFDAGDAVDQNDPAAHSYSLMSSHPPEQTTYHGPFSILRRDSLGGIDAGFAKNGIIDTFTGSNLSSNPIVELHAICIDPSTHRIVVAGSVEDSGSRRLLLLRLVPPAPGDGTAALDTTFNPTNDTPGALGLATQYRGEVKACQVAGDGTITVVGNDDGDPTANNGPVLRKIVIAKIKKDGSRANFGSNGVVELALADSAGAHVPEIRYMSTNNPAASGNNDFTVIGDAFPAGDMSSRHSMLLALDRCTGAPDLKFNGTGAFLSAVADGHTYDSGLFSRVLNDGSITAAFLESSGNPSLAVDLFAFPYPLAAGGGLLGTNPGTFTPPTAFDERGQLAINADGTVLVGGNGASTEHFLIELVGQANLGYTVGVPAAPACSLGSGRPTLNVLYSTDANTNPNHGDLDPLFNNDGAVPGLLVQAGDGNFYGTNEFGGVNGQGTLFRLTPAGVYTVLHTFSALNGAGVNDDGASPGTALTLGADGLLYGTATNGGLNGFGTVFKMTTDGVMTTLHHFNGADGSSVLKPLLQGRDGNFYGGTRTGGASDKGVLYKISPAGGFTVLHEFTGGGPSGDGRNIQVPFQDNDGMLWGVAGVGGAGFSGTIYRVAPDGTGFTLMHTFSAVDGNGVNADGSQPFGGLIRGPDGEFYGVTSLGGPNGNGTIFRMDHGGGFSVIYAFSALDGAGANADGAGANGNLTVGGDGNFYFPMGLGGPNGTGTILRITPAGVVTNLHSFGALDKSGHNSDGANPQRGLLLGRDGNFYGGTGGGGAHGTGGLYQFKLGTAAPLPTVAIDVTPAGVVPGANAQLVWSTNSANSCTASGAWSGSQATAGSITVMQSTPGTYTYTLACSGSGSASRSAKLTVVDLPATPAGLGALPGNAQVKLSWMAAANAASYNVYQGTAAGAEDVTPVKTGVIGASVTITGLNNGTQYFFYVTAVNAAGESSGSNEASATPVAPPPAPTGLTATVGNTKVTLNWTAAPGATTYNLYQGTAPGGEDPTPVRTQLPGTSVVVNGLTNGTRYYFRVSAVNAGGQSPKSNEAFSTPTAPPATPTGLTAAPGNTRVTLNWNAAAGAATYNVYQGTASLAEDPTPVRTGVSATTIIIGSLTNGTQYFFRVSAVNAGGMSAGKSNEAKATPVTPPVTPSGLTAAPGNASVTLAWTPTPGAAGYNVFMGTTALGEDPTPVLANVTATSGVVVSGLNNGTQYFFRINAFNGGGTSAGKSNEAKATPAPPPAAPSGLSAAVGNAKVTLSWTPVAGAASYNVFQGTSSGGEAATPVKTGVTATSGVVISSLTNGTQYFFKVSAVNGSGQSAQSNEASATPIALPATPAGLTATAGTNSVTLNWSPAAGAATYNVYQATTSLGQGNTPVLTGINGTSVIVNGLTAGTQYFFRVSAVNAAGESAGKSNEAKATPVAPGPAKSADLVGAFYGVAVNTPDAPAAQSTAVITFFANGTYIMGTQSNDPNCDADYGNANPVQSQDGDLDPDGNGSEFVSWTIAANGAISKSNPLVDSNGSAGFFDKNNASHQIFHTVDGNTLAIVDGNGTPQFYLKRIPSDNNSLVGAWTTPVTVGGSPAQEMFVAFADGTAIEVDANQKGGIQRYKYQVNGGQNNLLLITDSTVPNCIDTIGPVDSCVGGSTDPEPFSFNGDKSMFTVTRGAGPVTFTRVH